MRTPPRLQDLFHHRWMAPLLGELHRASGAKFVTLANRMGVGRASLRKTLETAIAWGWVIRNPGYGHPLRPEYILTPAGATLGPTCQRLVDWLRAVKLEDAILRKWPPAILVAISRGRRRFSELAAAVGGVTDRALAMSLRQLTAAGLVERTVVDAHPPVVEYRLAEAARGVVRRLASL